MILLRLSVINIPYPHVLAVVSGNHIYHVVPGECGRSVKTCQVHQDQLWRAVEGHTWTGVYEVISSVRGLPVADISNSTVTSVVKRV